jgi:hypothetical protein
MMHESETISVEERLEQIERTTEDGRISASTEALEVPEAISRGAADRLWSVRHEVDGDLRYLRWDHERQVWAGAEGFVYEPPAKVPSRGGH